MHSVNNSPESKVRSPESRVMVIARRTLFQALLVHAVSAHAFAQARVNGKPKPLATEAVTHDWTSFLGPTHNAVSTETRLSRTLPPPLVWEIPKGTSYASPAVIGDRLLFVHRVGDEEIVECMQIGRASCRERV